jgi:hydroxymethylpyrimidine pyrophosphatase-like HAD family hydrolase
MIHFPIVSTDFDGTLAKDGKVDRQTYESLQRLKKSGRKLFLVTGRQLEDLLSVFPEAGVCDCIIAENGALLYYPAEEAMRLLGEPPSPEFIQLLRERKVEPLSIGRVIVATWTPMENRVMEVIRELGLELQIIFNKGAVMVLPPGINKSTGLLVALQQQGDSPEQVAGIGDAENDHAFLKTCGYSVAVANALDSVKQSVNFVSAYDHGAGVRDYIDRLLEL